jgi:hypothetical protein
MLMFHEAGSKQATTPGVQENAVCVTTGSGRKTGYPVRRATA